MNLLGARFCVIERQLKKLAGSKEAFKSRLCQSALTAC
jgi:hypothetical protein